MVKGKIVMKAADIKREKGYFYFLDKRLNVRRVKRNSKNGKPTTEKEK